MNASIDTGIFRRALSCFPTGVAVITTKDARGKPVGLTCNSFSSVSLDPPLVLWSLRLQSRLYPAFRSASAFGINMLADGQKNLSARFASSSDDNRFAGIGWSEGVLGVPLLNTCIARFECSMHFACEAGDHMIFIGEVKHLDAPRNEDPLVFYRGSYMMVAQSLRDLTASGRLTLARLREATSLVFGSLVRLACLHGTEKDFNAIAEVLRTMDELMGPEDAPARKQAGLLYFRLIAKASHNEILEAIAESLNTILKQLFTSDPTARLRTELVAIRQEVLYQLRARDVPGAMAAMESYFNVRLPQLQILAATQQAV